MWLKGLFSKALLCINWLTPRDAEHKGTLHLKKRRQRTSGWDCVLKIIPLPKAFWTGQMCVFPLDIRSDTQLWVCCSIISRSLLQANLLFKPTSAHQTDTSSPVPQWVSTGHLIAKGLHQTFLFSHCRGGCVPWQYRHWFQDHAFSQLCIFSHSMATLLALSFMGSSLSFKPAVFLD